MMDDLNDDSFDDVLASMDMPTAPKQPKMQAPNETVASSSSSSSSSTAGTAKPLPSNPHSVLVHTKQRGNPILKSILNVPLEFRDDIVPDYVVGRTSCVLFLSLKYHNLNPDYICQRLKALGKMYELRVLLVQVDTPEPHSALKSLTRISLLADLTMMLAWNSEEAGKIIETYKQFEKRPPDLIMERVDSNPHQKVRECISLIVPIQLSLIASIACGSVNQH